MIRVERSTNWPRGQLPRIEEASREQISLVRELFEEYAASLPFDLAFQGFAQELASLPGDYRCILIAFQNAEPAGCIALRSLEPGIAEMKRLYVRQKFQGNGIGRALAEALLEKAASMGFRRVRLDTTPGMRTAIAMYEAMGFAQIAPYRENPVAGASYWEKVL